MYSSFSALLLGKLFGISEAVTLASVTEFLHLGFFSSVSLVILAVSLDSHSALIDFGEEDAASLFTAQVEHASVHVV